MHGQSVRQVAVACSVNHLSSKVLTINQDVKGDTAPHIAAKNLQNKDGQTVLQMAVACSNYHSFIDYLSSVVDVRIRDVNGDTALHIAAKNCLSEQRFNVLLRGRHGMDAVNVLNNQGRTPLMEGIISGNTGAVIALCHVTDINNSDVEGKTALHYAVLKKVCLYVEMLVERDVNLTVRDTKGNTPLSLACSLHHFEDKCHLQLIFQMYKYGVAYGEQLNMI